MVMDAVHRQKERKMYVTLTSVIELIKENNTLWAPDIVIYS